MTKQKKYYAVFCIKEQGIFDRIRKKRINPANKVVRFRKNAYVIDFGFPTHRRGLKQYFFIDIEKGQSVAKHAKFKIGESQVLFVNNEKEKPIMSPKLLDMIVSQKIVGQLTSNLGDSAWRMNIMNIILGLIMGGLIGYIVAGYL